MTEFTEDLHLYSRDNDEQTQNLMSLTTVKHCGNVTIYYNTYLEKHAGCTFLCLRRWGPAIRSEMQSIRECRGRLVSQESNGTRPGRMACCVFPLWRWSWAYSSYWRLSNVVSWNVSSACSQCKPWGIDLNINENGNLNATSVGTHGRCKFWYHC